MFLNSYSIIFKTEKNSCSCSYYKIINLAIALLTLWASHMYPYSTTGLCKQYIYNSPFPFSLQRPVLISAPVFPLVYKFCNVPFPITSECRDHKSQLPIEHVFLAVTNFVQLPPPPPPPPTHFFNKIIGEETATSATLVLVALIFFFCLVSYLNNASYFTLNPPPPKKNPLFFRNEVSAHKYGTGLILLQILDI